MTWYTTGGGVDEWVLALRKRFKESPSTAMTAITKERTTAGG